MAALAFTQADQSNDGRFRPGALQDIFFLLPQAVLIFAFQVICLPVGPRCDVCLLGQRRICPSRVSNVKVEGRKEVLYTFTAEDDEEGLAKVEVKYEQLVPLDEGVVKQEILEQPALSEEGVLEVLDRVDGVTEIGQDVGGQMDDMARGNDG